MKIVLISTDENIEAIGVKTLSACLIEQGFKIAIVLMSTSDENYNKFCWKDLEAICYDAGLIGISCMTHGVRKAIEVKNYLKYKITAPIIIGGIHASLSPESLLDDFDLVCHGEGEDMLIELAKRLSNNEPYYDIPGLWVKIDNSIIRNQNKPLKRDLNDYPFPDYDLSHQYILRANRLIQMRPNPTCINLDYFVVLGSRGCPHHCTYCCNQKIKEEFPWRKIVRHYSVDYLINHLEEVCRIYPNVRGFWIDDDTFFAKRLNEIREFSEKYKNKINKPFLILISPWTYDEDKIKPLINVGMNRLIMGIQSGSENVTRNIYDRIISNERFMEIAKSLHKYSDLTVCYDFIGMNPFETEEDLISTIRFIRNLPEPFFIYNNNLAFYPGTRLYEIALKSGIDVSKRVKHSDVRIGYAILKDENIQHKLFHFIILLMAGNVNNVRIGRVPRFFVSDQFITFYGFLNRKLGFITNKAVHMICVPLIYIQFKKIIKRILGPKVILNLKMIYYKLLSKCSTSMKKTG